MNKPQKLLVDADFLVALAKKDDSNHQKALKTAQAISNDNLCVTPFVIAEAATVLSYRVSHAAAKMFLSGIRNKNLAEISLDSESKKEADKIFLEQNRKRTSWVDCLNATVVKTYELDGIMSFDKFYRRLGIKMF